MLAENVFQRRGVEPTTTVPTSHHHHHHHDHDLQLRSHAHAHRATFSASSASPPMMDDRSPLASPSRVVTGFAASAASSYDGGPGVGGPGAASPPVASPRARAVARALLGEALDADAKTRVVVGLGGVMDTTTKTTAPMDDSMKSDVSVLSGSLYDDLDDAVGGRPRSREEDEEEEDAVNCGGFARSSPIDIPTWDRKPAHWKTCV
jgi:hypothetical protein